jgi:RNA polymerase sigma factor (sigma-70 family)
MITKAMLNPEADDIALVAESLTGNRDAFGLIVHRYQSLICALAYNATGSLSQSEDLAQETFLAAWRQLSALREPAKLRAWLCRISRNITYDALKKQGREPMHGAESLEAAHESHATEDSPTDHAISREEEAILWRSIESIPEPYREPLILFYRQHQSIPRVAEALELTDDAVKQRLSRGRKLLRAQVLAFVEGALERTNPGAGFTQSVLLALPVMTATSATTATTAALKAGATAKAASLALGGFFLILSGNYAGYRGALAMASSEREKSVIKRFYGRLLAAAVLCSVAVVALVIWGSRSAKDYPTLFAWTISVLGFGSILTFLVIIFRSVSRTRGLAPTPCAPVWEYRSPLVILGLPLVHIRIGGSNEPVKAWFAAGGFAVGGLFAFGGLAIAPICVGGLALGLLPWGGMAVGVIAMGGLAAGGWVFGGVAVGWEAYGACAIAWKASVGAAALAHDFALGSIAQAAQAGNAAAETYVKSSEFFQSATWLTRYAGWLNVLWVLPMLLWWRLAARRPRSDAPAA